MGRVRVKQENVHTKTQDQIPHQHLITRRDRVWGRGATTGTHVPTVFSDIFDIFLYIFFLWGRQLQDTSGNSSVFHLI